MDARKPAAFPKPPKSALFDRLEAFLPVLATENKKLEEAIASGDGDRHNIEIQETDDAEAKQMSGDADEEDEDEEDSDVEMDEGGSAKPPVIEMNFALGLMEEGGSDSDSDSEDEQAADSLDLASIVAAANGQNLSQKSDGAGEKELQQLNLGGAKPPATRPLIQELN